MCDSFVSVIVLNINGGTFSVCLFFFYFKFCFVLLETGFLSAALVGLELCRPGWLQRPVYPCLLSAGN